MRYLVFLILFLSLAVCVQATCAPEEFFSGWVKSGDKPSISGVGHEISVRGDTALVIYRDDGEKLILRLDSCRSIGGLNYCFNDSRAISSSKYEGKLRVGGMIGKASLDRKASKLSPRIGEIIEIRSKIRNNDCADVQDLEFKDSFDSDFELISLDSGPCVQRGSSIIYEEDEFVKGKSVECVYKVRPLINGTLKPIAVIKHSFQGVVDEQEVYSKFKVKPHALRVDFKPDVSKVNVNQSFDLMIFFNNTDEDYGASLIYINLDFNDFIIEDVKKISKKDDLYQWSGNLDKESFEFVELKLKYNSLDPIRIPYQVEYKMDDLQTEYVEQGILPSPYEVEIIPDNWESEKENGGEPQNEVEEESGEVKEESGEVKEESEEVQEEVKEKEINEESKEVVEETKKETKDEEKDSSKNKVSEEDKSYGGIIGTIATIMGLIIIVALLFKFLKKPNAVRPRDE